MSNWQSSEQNICETGFAYLIFPAMVGVLQAQQSNA